MPIHEGSEHAATLGHQIGSQQNDAEWWVHDGKTRGATGLCSTFKFGLCPTSTKVNLTVLEINIAYGRMLLIKQKIEGDRNEKYQEKLRQLNSRHKKLINEYTRRFGGEDE